MAQLKNIIFDVGNVLLEYRWKEMLMDFGLSEEDALRVGKEMFEDSGDLWSEFDIGNLSFEEIVSRYCSRHPKDRDAISFFLHHSEYMHIPRPEIWRRIPLLKEKGYQVYILSNYSDLFFRRHTEYADFIPEMDGILVSYMIHKIKPDPAIYQELCGRFSLRPEECLFFDDRKENVDAAIHFGMQSIQVTGRKQLAREIDTLLRK